MTDLVEAKQDVDISYDVKLKGSSSDTRYTMKEQDEVLLPLECPSRSYCGSVVVDGPYHDEDLCLLSAMNSNRFDF